MISNFTAHIMKLHNCLYFALKLLGLPSHPHRQHQTPPSKPSGDSRHIYETLS